MVGLDRNPIVRKMQIIPGIRNNAGNWIQPPTITTIDTGPFQPPIPKIYPINIIILLENIYIPFIKEIIYHHLSRKKEFYITNSCSMKGHHF
jgi:hypothetical protein